MIKKIVLILVLIFAYGLSKVSAHYGQYTGCLSANTQYIYYTSYGTYKGVPNFNWDQGYYDGERIALSNTYCSNVYGGNNSCRINGSGSGSTYGKLVTFYFFPCPIDDYIPLLLVAIGGFGFLILRKRTTNSFFYL
ncbi:hypothetical protein WG904_15850 [Pedobacter sp. Du54]|uniref:hypothetical protein n=1 Tax=Pedobacter anseongensis TaxID=3133439 RepID=UPI003099907C